MRGGGIVKRQKFKEIQSLSRLHKGAYEEQSLTASGGAPFAQGSRYAKHDEGSVCKFGLSLTLSSRALPHPPRPLPCGKVRSNTVLIEYVSTLKSMPPLCKQYH